MSERGVADTATLDASRAPELVRVYLLVVEAGSSRVFPLHPQSIVTIGRAPEIELSIDDPSVSRRHARITSSDGIHTIADLESHNGTRVNGHVLDGTRALAVGDVIAVGEVYLVVHGELARPSRDAVLDDTAFRQRLAEEVQRSATFGRTLAVLAVEDAVSIADVRGALRT